MPCRATQDRWVTVKSADKTWSTGGGNGNTLQHSCGKNPMKSIKRQEAMTTEDEPSCRKVSNVLLGKSRGLLLIIPERKKQLDQSGNNTQLWICLVVKVKSSATKNNIA